MQLSWAQFKIVFFKELLEAARDPRSLIPLIILSLLTGPALTCLYPSLIAGTVRHEVQEGCKVGCPNQEPGILALLKRANGVKIVELGDIDARQALLDRKVDAVVTASGDFDKEMEGLTSKESDKLPTVNIQYDGKSGHGYFAALRVRAFFEGFRESKVEERKKLAAVCRSEPELVELKAEPENLPKLVYVPQATTCASPFLQSWLVSIIVFMAMMSILYPALDAITGERERGTLEYLLATSVQRGSLFVGKLATIVFCSYCSVFCALLGFFLAQYFQPKTSAFMPLPFTSTLPVPCFLLLCLAMLPLCLTLSSAALALASFSRTVQQGQGYLSPLLTLAMMPIVISLYGGIHLSASLAMVPYLGSIVAMNDILAGRLDWPWFILSMLVSVAFSLALTMIVSPVVEREDILFGLDQSPQRRFSEGDFRREIFFLGATVFLLMFYVSQNLVIEHHLIGLALTQVLLILFPGLLLVLFWLKLPWRNTLRLKLPRGGVLVKLCSLLGAALLAPLTVTLAGLIAAACTRLMPGSQALSKIMAQLMGIEKEPLWLLFLVIGILPGICEEILFRGVILSLLPRSYSDRKRILVVGTLFGAFHMSILRFTPTALLGLVLTYLALATGSILPCMILHGCHNMLSVYVAVHYKDVSPPAAVIAAAIGSGLVGLGLLYFSTVAANKQSRKDGPLLG
jgi:sodium transport system permease protein